MEVTPLRIIPPPLTPGEGDHEKSPSVKLGLGIGVSVIIKEEKVDDDDDGDRRMKPSLTASQLRELQEQALIFKYLAAGISVPPRLVLPIWKSVVASSFGSVNGRDAIYRQYPSLGFSPQGFDYRNRTDPEPGRCRRTDGKKWRCSKNVILGQKYCERHMHRGRQRSRKPVEAAQVTTSANTPPGVSSKNSNPNSVSTTARPQLLSLLSTNNNASHSTPATTTSIADFKITSSNIASTSSGGRKSTEMNLNTSVVSNTSRKSIITSSFKTETSSSSTTLTDVSSKSSLHKECRNICNRKSNYDSSENYRMSSNTRSIKSSGNNTSHGFDFSPKSVLQVQGCSREPLCSALGCQNACLCRSDQEHEPWRCRRTDGKKWRCRRDVVTNEKYCEMHMHRGAKKHVEATVNVPNRANCTYLNTNLSISIAASPPRCMTGDERSATSTSSDATISDTTPVKC